VVALLVAWNLLLMVNFTYVIRGSDDPGYLGLVAGQLKALPYLPHLVSQGAVGRMLLFWPALKLSFQPLPGLLLLAGEAASLLGALAVGRLLLEPAAPGNERQEAAEEVEVRS
jgi:hypothetical protein